MNLDIKSIILARGGSKGLPRKNLIDLCGKPLISYAISASLSSSFVKETWVSTDDKEIEMVSKSLGAFVLKRPSEFAMDFSPSEDALLHFHKNIPYDVLVFIQPTSPQIKAEYIDSGISKLIADNLDSVFSVTKKHWIPTWSLDISPIGWNPNNRPRRQDRPEYYEENGAFYITTRSQFAKTNNRYGGKMGIIEVPLEESFQIDTMEDLVLVRKLMENPT